jgi:hypothetical protein
MKLEIKKLYFWRSRVTGQSMWMPAGLNIVEQLWWRFMPGVVVTVRWPIGWVSLENDSQSDQTFTARSADPNDHYRPWMEANVGRQGWDWDWGMANNDARNDTLTIKIRQKHAAHATIIALKWA